MTAPRYSEKVRAFFESRAITEAGAAAAKVREIDGALAFPYTAPNGSTYHRLRDLNGTGPAKVRQPKGVPLDVGWPLGRPEVGLAENVIVTEGETDAVAVISTLIATDSPDPKARRLLRDFGLRVCAVPGASFPPRRLADELRALGTRTAYLAFDGDDAGRRASEAAAEELRSAGVKVRELRLPDRRDLADCLAEADDRPAWLAGALIDWSAAAEEREHAEADASPPRELRLVPLADFAAASEPSAEALLGTDDDAAFTADGMVITYGDGGQGKTTLAIDGIAHLAAGVRWLGLEVPRALRIVVVENEGPRGRFRRKLRRKLETWTGPPFEHNVWALEEPCGEFTFADDRLRSALASGCAEFEADLLVIGPLVSLGAEGGGTPEEVARFEALLARFRAEVARPLLVWIAHHENKAGDVSGAWERLPDTLMHVRLEGRAQTKLHWRKVRWSSALHDERWTLRWLEDREGFERVDEPERDVRAEILALWEDDAERWRTATEVAAKRDDGGIGRQRNDVQRELDALFAEGELEREEGPAGRHKNAVCYRPAGLDRGSSQDSQEALPVEQAELDRPTPVREGGSSRTAEQPPSWPGAGQEAEGECLGRQRVEERRT